MRDVKKRPNILFLMADQFRADVLSCAGGPAQTPNLDALAAEGVLFTECYTPSPLCVPARISMMTGCYPHTTGAWNNAAYVLDPEAGLWTKAVREQGYGTAVFGKLHLHTDFGDMIAREYLVHGYGFDTVNEVSGPRSTCQTRTHMSEEWKAKGLWEDYCRDMRARSKAPRALPTPLPTADYYDAYVGRKGREFIEEYRGEKPWFCHVSFPGPHEPWDAPEDYAARYDPADMPPPLPTVRERAETRPTGEYDRLMAKEEIRCDGKTAGEIRANYCGSVSLIDQQVGELIAAIKARGDWDNTVVLFTSDHGELNGDHGFVNKRNFFRPALQVPLLIRTPETARMGGRVSGALTSLLDVGPTLAELAGASLDYEQFGRSLCPLLLGEQCAQRECILAEYAGERMLYDGKWKLVTNRRGEGYLLFDLEADPTETENLAGLPEYREQELLLKERLLRAVAENTRLRPAPLQLRLETETGDFIRSVAAE